MKILYRIFPHSKIAFAIFNKAINKHRLFLCQINFYPHDTSSYTQGLIIYKGDMYEGTGMYRKSKLMRVDLKTGKILMDVEINKSKPPETIEDSLYFGEGITILRDTIYQLTWRNK